MNRPIRLVVGGLVAAGLLARCTPTLNRVGTPGASSATKSVSGVSFSSSGLTIQGNHLSGISQVQIQDSSGHVFHFTITGKTDSLLQASVSAAASFVIGAAYQLILVDAKADSYPVTFQIPNGSVTPAQLDRAYLTANGPLVTAFTSVQSNYPVTSTDSVILANAGTGALTVTLPSASGNGGRQYQIKKIDQTFNLVTLATGGGTIDGANTLALSQQWQFVQVVSDGANWQVISTSAAASPVYCGNTAATNGNAGGWSGVAAKCRALAGCNPATAHMCSWNEMSRYYQNGGNVLTPTVALWIADSYVDSYGTGQVIVDACQNWGSSSVSDNGAALATNHAGMSYASCNQSLLIACCQ